MNGRIIIDLMKVAMRDYKLDSFKLDNVAFNNIKSFMMNKNKKDLNTEYEFNS